MFFISEKVQALLSSTIGLLKVKCKRRAAHLLSSEQFLTSALRYILTPLNKISVLQNVCRARWFWAQAVGQVTNVPQRRGGRILTALMNQRHEVLLVYRAILSSESFIKPMMPGYQRATPCHLLECLQQP